MIGMLSPPPVKNIRVDGKKIPIIYVEAFVADLYLNAKLDVPDEFNPVTEIVRVVNALRDQGKVTK